MPAQATRRRLIVTLIICLSAMTAGFATAEPREPQLSSAAAQELWKKGSNQVLAGNFEAAAGTLKQVQTLEPGHTEVKDALKWMQDAESLAQSRERLRVRNYDHFVAEAQKAAKEAKEGKKTPSTAEDAEKAKKANDQEPEAEEPDAGVRDLPNRDIEEATGSELDKIEKKGPDSA